MSKKKYVKGYIGENSSGDKYIVEDYSNGVITIRFLDTGYTTKTTAPHIISGNIRDRLKPSVAGVGYLGKYNTTDHYDEYNLWKGIIERCYNVNRRDYLLYGFKGVTVSERWKCFSNFLDDITLIDGYDDEKFHSKCLDLDKDIKQSDKDISEKIYSLETCMFVDNHVNRGITKRKPTKDVAIISIKDDYVLETFCPVEELAKKIGVKTQYINRILNGGAKTHNGWTFKYA